MPDRPRLTPAMADARRAVRAGFAAAELGEGDLVLVACSGGADSLALAAAIGFEAPRAGLRAGAVIIDHGLQANSAAVAQRAAEQCRELGLEPVAVRQASVQVGRTGLEAAAREARYAELEAARSQLGARVVALGHNLNDQAETVLLGLTRGSGLRSLAGMQGVSGCWLRPFLGLSRELLETSCRDQGITFWSDPHNADSAFTRVRLRKLLAELEFEVGPGIAEALAKTAQQLREAEQVIAAEASKLEQLARAGGSGRSLRYQVSVLAQALPALRKRALQLAAQRAGGHDLNAAHLDAADALVSNWHGQKSLSLPGITVGREGEQIVFKLAQPPKPGAC
jgi:tRNA(Ile)-lysidine synthase